jgi:hypothetical protein
MWVGSSCAVSGECATRTKDGRSADAVSPAACNHPIPQDPACPWLETRRGLTLTRCASSRAIHPHRFDATCSSTSPESFIACPLGAPCTAVPVTSAETSASSACPLLKTGCASPAEHRTAHQRNAVTADDAGASLHPSQVPTLPLSCRAPAASAAHATPHVSPRRTNDAAGAGTACNQVRPVQAHLPRLIVCNAPHVVRRAGVGAGLVVRWAGGDAFAERHAGVVRPACVARGEAASRRGLERLGEACVAERMLRAAIITGVLAAATGAPAT